MVIRVPDQRSAQGAYERLDDRMLVLDFQAGHPEAFVEIHSRYSPLARRVCLRFLRNQQDADEAFQETMIRVFQGLHRFNGRYALSPWVARIAKNVSLDIIRSRGRRPQEESDGTDAPELEDKGVETPEAAYERLVERDLVLSVLADMPVPHRDALVLRELEGRSHREIAHEMDISTSQAKALIHRAKASFRRRWLVAVTEKGRLSAIAVLPLLWAAKVVDVGKRFVDRVGHATHLAQAAPPEVVAVASATSAAPAAAVGIGERVVAAGMTILLAGGVTVGAAKIVEQRADRTEQAAAVLAPVLEEIDEGLGVAASEEPDGDVETEPVLEGPVPPVEPIRPPVVEPLPSVEPSTPPETSPPPDPSPTPTEPAEPTEPPGPPPAPAWTFDVTSSTTSVESCTCPSDSELIFSQVDHRADGFTFSQGISGGALDAAGDLTWAYSLQLWGEVQPAGGLLEYRFTLHSGAGTHLYGGTASLAEVTELETGALVYRFEGTFDLQNHEQPVAGLPWRGFVSATVQVWPDGSIYGGSLSLEDVTA